MADFHAFGPLCCLCFEGMTGRDDGTHAYRIEDGRAVAYDVCVPCAVIECAGWLWRES